MSRGVGRCLAILALMIGVAVFAKAGSATAADAVNGTLKATGKAGSGEVSIAYSGTASAAGDTLQADFYVWGGVTVGWQLSGSKQLVNLAAAGNFNFTAPPITLTTGRAYRAALFLLQGNPPVVVAQNQTNALTAP